MKSTELIIIAFGGLFLSSTALSRAPVAPSPEAARWEQVLEWLPEDTETLTVATKTFDFPKLPKPVDDYHSVQRWSIVQQIALLPVCHFNYLAEGLPAEGLFSELSGLKCLTSVEGYRRMTPEGKFWLMDYQGALVLQFDPAGNDQVKRFFESCQKKATETLELVSQPVAVFSFVNGKETRTYLLSQPRPGLVILATHEGYLEDTLKRMGGSSKKRALPADLPEWKLVDVKAAIWAIRHYRKDSADNDPTSPLSSTGLAKDHNDNAAVGFVFWYNPEAGKTMQARYLSGSNTADEIASKSWSNSWEDFKPKVKKGAAGVVEISVELDTKDTVLVFMLVLMQILGHGFVV